MSMVKIMTEAMSMVKFSSLVFRVLNEEKVTRKRKKMTEASASVCLILATALPMNRNGSSRDRKTGTEGRPLPLPKTQTTCSAHHFFLRPVTHWKPFNPQYENKNSSVLSHTFLIEVVGRGCGTIKLENLSSVILSLILITCVIDQAMILQGENWLWSISIRA